MSEVEAVEVGQVGPGRPPIAPEREQFSMVLPKPILDEIRDVAKAEGNSVAAVVRRRLAKQVGQ